MKLSIKNTFTEELPKDSETSQSRRQVFKACFSEATPRIPSNPSLIHVTDEVLESLGMTELNKQSDDFLKIVTGGKVYTNTTPYAMCYGGHQFGHWAGQLGDGRAINLFEVNHNSVTNSVQLKGAGETPYSRTADGLAVLRSSIREYLCAEAMHHLGVPTTRSLSLALSGDEVLRDVMYNGNQAYEKGAIVCRVAPSFIRFGSFEIHSSRNDVDTLKQLVDYTIKHHFPNCKPNSKEGYIQFFNEVVTTNMDMVVHWQRVGFVHGVMNTDNMSIHGLTIDYGPYGWLEGYDPGWTPNTTDKQNKRYRFGNQPQVVFWNLIQLAQAIYPLINDAEPLEEILNNFHTNYSKKHTKMMTSKIGLNTVLEGDKELIIDLESLLMQTETDMTLFFRNLSEFNADSLITETPDYLGTILNAFYNPEDLKGALLTDWSDWFKSYKKRLAKNTLLNSERVELMNSVNPKYVLRNYISQLVIDEADKGNYDLLNEVYAMLKQPYKEQPEYNKWFAKRPEWARNKVGCSMLSCSS